MIEILTVGLLGGAGLLLIFVPKIRRRLALRYARKTLEEWKAMYPFDTENLDVFELSETDDQNNY